ncbi:MAG TPA: twin-arginine translocase TatA/TatE family subunit [Abditibacteriaceae bacterium]|nr:twin-arginine translocase TatA/TatE family subunit [Abditibacteriaceae bacterium]
MRNKSENLKSEDDSTCALRYRVLDSSGFKFPLSSLNQKGAIMPGGGEILVILVLVLLLFGPDKLPDLARQLGRGVRELNRVRSNLTDQFNLMGDDDTPQRSRNNFDAQSNAFSADSRMEEDEPMNWNSNTAKGNTNDHGAHSNGALGDSLRDEDDLAEDEADWRSCEEEPALQTPQAEEPRAENLGAPTSFDRLSEGERPTPPGAVARSSSLPRAINNEEHTSE